MLAAKKEKAIKSFQQVCKRFPKSGQASRSHAHLQNKYKITVTLGGANKLLRVVGHCFPTVIDGMVGRMAR